MNIFEHLSFQEPFEESDLEPDIPTREKEPDSESSTTFYSVASEPEFQPDKKGVHFGNSAPFGNSLDLCHESLDEIFDEALEETMSPSKKSPLKKLKKLFKSTSKEYDLPPTKELTKPYVDMPKLSVNPIYNEDSEMVEETVNNDISIEEATFEPSTR